MRKKRLQFFFANNNFSFNFVETIFSVVETFFFAIGIYSTTTTNIVKSSNILSNFSANSSSTIISFLVDIFKKIETEYIYRKYFYTKEKIAFSRKFDFDNICYNIDINIICAN